MIAPMCETLGMHIWLKPKLQSRFESRLPCLWRNMALAAECSRSRSFANASQSSDIAKRNGLSRGGGHDFESSWNRFHIIIPTAPAFQTLQIKNKKQFKNLCLKNRHKTRI
jgi:hypothetical protein